MKKISITVPCFNSAEYLPRCVDSIKSQTMSLSDIEVIFVNDASTDEGATLEALRQYEIQAPDVVKVINHECNKRQGGSRNTGIDYATGEYLAFVDPDDFIAPGYCEELYKIASENEADVVQFGHCDYIVENAQVKLTRELRWNSEVRNICGRDDRIDFVINGSMTLGNWNKLYRRELLLDAGVRFGENTNYEEPLFTYPLKYYVNKYVSVGGIYYYWQNRQSSILHTDMMGLNCIEQHKEQAKELLKFMKQTPFYEEYGKEIDFRFIHSYLLETLAFCGKKEHVPSRVMYKKMCEEFKSIMEGRLESNPYIAPPSFYSTIIKLTDNPELPLNVLGEIVASLAEL